MGLTSNTGLLASVLQRPTVRQQHNEVGYLRVFMSETYIDTYKFTES